MSPRKCFGAPPPGLDPLTLTGILVVIEGPDGSGRSTHIQRLTAWLEELGHPVVRTGLRRSMLVGPDLDAAKQGNTLSPRTLSLLYATDFYDQMENVIVPALQAGSIVLADRYVFTLMARDLVRGADPAWVESLYSRALVADAVFYLRVPLETLVDRTLACHGVLDYWESGMDLGLSRDWFESYMLYQRRIARAFARLQARYGFVRVDSDRPIADVQAELRRRMTPILRQVQSRTL